MSLSNGNTGGDPFSERRFRMVERQLQRRDITDINVLNAMRKLPRHQFVPEESVERAYEDRPVSIGHGQTISQPYMVASMTQELKLEKTDKVLEIGTGCGYQTAVLAEMTGEIYSIERIGELLIGAQARLGRLGYQNVIYRRGDGSEGWPEQAPFDAILVAAAADKLPHALIDQLADPGRMIIPIGSSHLSQDLILYTRLNGITTRKSLYAVRFVPLKSG